MDNNTVATVNSESEHSRNSRFEIIHNDATVSTRRFSLSDARTVLLLRSTEDEATREECC